MGRAAAVSVAVGVWTLVAISLERYFAICRPLKSRIWQTRSHAYKMIIAIWILSLSLCLPVAVLSRLKPIRETGKSIQLVTLTNSICRQTILRDKRLDRKIFGNKRHYNFG